jgi:hypothetical protein
MGAPALKGFFVGSMVGLVLGSTIPASAFLGWVAGSTLQNTNRNFQLGYVAGVDDTVQAIVNSTTPMSALKRKADCFAKHHSSLGLGTFGDWALTLPRGDPMGAASLIIRRACE